MMNQKNQKINKNELSTKWGMVAANHFLLCCRRCFKHLNLIPFTP